MAKNNRIFDLPETKGSFQITGKVTGTERDSFSKEMTTKTGKPMRLIYFGVNYEENKGVGISLNGMEQEKVYASKTEGTGKDKKIETKEFNWKERFNIPSDYRLIGVNVGVKKTLDEKGKEVNDKKRLTPFDACKEISENLTDDVSVFVRGNIDYSSYNDKTSVKFVPAQISLCKDVDFEADDYKVNSQFTQRIVFMGIEPDDNDKNQFIVSAKIVTYSSIEDAEFYINDKGLATLFKKNLKPYSSIDVWGDIVTELNTEEVEETSNTWGSKNSMERQNSPVQRKLYITGADGNSIDTEIYSRENIEEAIVKISASKKANEEFYGSKSNKSDTWGNANLDDVDDEDDDLWD